MTFRRNPDSPLKTGVVNYRNRPFNKFYMVNVYVGNQSPAGQLKVSVLDMTTATPTRPAKRIIVPYGQHLREEYSQPLMVAPPSIPDTIEAEMQFGPYKSRRAAAVDAKTIVRNLLLGMASDGEDTGGTITEMYELTDGGEKYVQVREFPPSSVFKSVGRAAVANSPYTDIVVGYLGTPYSSSYPIYARIQTILPDQAPSSLSKKVAKQEDAFFNAWEALEIPEEELDDAADLTDRHWYEPQVSILTQFGAKKSKKKAEPKSKATATKKPSPKAKPKKAAPKVKVDFQRDSKGAYEIFIGEKKQSKKITKPKSLNGGFRFDFEDYNTLKEAKAAAEKFYSDASNVRSNPSSEWDETTIMLLVNDDVECSLAELREDNPDIESEWFDEIAQGEKGDVFYHGHGHVEILN